MHNPIERIIHPTAFVTPVVEHWLEREIAQWVYLMKDRSDDPSHHERISYHRATSRSPKPIYIKNVLLQRLKKCPTPNILNPLFNDNNLSFVSLTTALNLFIEKRKNPTINNNNNNFKKPTLSDINRRTDIQNTHTHSSNQSRLQNKTNLLLVVHKCYKETLATNTYWI